MGNANSKVSFYISLLLVFIVIILMVSLIPLFLVADTNSTLNSSINILRPSKVSAGFHKSRLLQQDSFDRKNVVFLGFDRTTDSLQKNNIGRPDTIIVVSFDNLNRRLAIVSIPRDSYVKIYGSDDFDKLNHAYSRGYFNAANDGDQHLEGLETLLMTIEDFLGGVRLHNYIIADIDGIAEMIDLLGGINLYVENDIPHRKKDGELLLEKGYQHLSGRQFMDYIRNRCADQGGDMGRIERQQRVLLYLYQQLVTPNSAKSIMNLFETVEPLIETDLGFNEMMMLSAITVGFDLNALDRYIFSGEGEFISRNGKIVWYLFIDEEERIRIIREAFGFDVNKRVVPETNSSRK